MSDFFAVFLALLAFSLVASPGPFFGKDDSDPASGRSGLAIYTDYKTGVQYLATPQGGLAVRVDADGTPVTVGQPDGR